MSIHVALHHRTTYRYDRLVSLGPQLVRLRPAPHCRTRILSYSQKVVPAKHFINWQQDAQSNWIARLVFPDQTTQMSIEIDVVFEMAAMNPFDFFLEPYAEKWPFDYDASLLDELAPYRKTLPSTPLFEKLAASVPRDARATNVFLVELNQRLSQEIEYCVRLEAGLFTPEETLEKKKASCRDSAWLLVQLLRRLGLAARFVSGYLVQLVADVAPLEGPAGPLKDFCDLHAWCEVYLPGAGWIGLDPTSGLLAGEGHIPLACSAEPSSAAPVSGLVDACETEFAHEMKVTRVRETPRVTKPYTDDEWERVLRVGRAVDAVLDKGDVRLTMGGEPTFIADADFDAAEWNTAALGPTKKKLATELFHRLRKEYAPKGLVHFGQGKWYPGEPLPRWALSLFWRRDGEPLWADDSLIADEKEPSGAKPETAARLIAEVASRLGIDGGAAFAAYEDVFYYLWRERKLPVNVDPLDAKLGDKLERERLRRLFEGGLDKPVGWVIPVAKKPGEKKWRTTPWQFRGGHCFLVPGDSPLGLRLPLDSLPWEAKPEPKAEAPDPSVDREPLPKRDALKSEGEKDKTWFSRAALCAEPRGGVLWIFMPPVDALDDYVELLAAIEGAAEALRVPVLIEGYAPPRDARLATLSVTPDPGVIEVNIHPSSDWNELVGHTTHLYEAARQSKLVAEKFMLDGRHAGTGGGNHVVLGGKTANDSPFLRRPDLLRSLVSYFHQHPSLSFLFSGMFIGPTSQAPRLDEARNDSVFEIEVAFRELTRKMAEKNKDKDGKESPPWLVDRLFRDLLVDVTGNTHRAEICIDKLFSPDGPTGRLGLVELRSLEMPPHARMSLVQQLLLRALVARCWKEPFAPDRLTRWGTELHDRFMLPHWVWKDFGDVIEDLRAHGHALDVAWFAPHYEFRFPKLGDFEANGVHIELRTALEPWHVMGEEVAAGGTARFVDSSLERVQVEAKGMAPDRYFVTCNRRAIPIHDGVGGVRYRAWQPPRCLHPTIAVHTPLVFDLFDRWTGRSLGGCEYHVSHPGGRNYETRPINALEAEGRRRARFFRTGHTPGEMTPVAVEADPEFPLTLDLRRA